MAHYLLVSRAKQATALTLSGLPVGYQQCKLSILHSAWQ